MSFYSIFDIILNQYSSLNFNLFGGEGSFYINGNKTYIFYNPEINIHVKKVYKNKKYYDNELKNIDILDNLDTTFLYHSNILDRGIINRYRLINEYESIIKPLTDIQKILSKDVYYYIDAEYNGNNLNYFNNTLRKEITPEEVTIFTNNYIDFLLNILLLLNDGTKYIVYGDIHGGNICYKKEEHYTFKIIDLGQIKIINGDTLCSDRDIEMQFQSLCGTINIICGLRRTQIFSDLTDLVSNKSFHEKTYSDVLIEFIDILNRRQFEYI